MIGMVLKIGILDVQGAVSEHAKSIRNIGAQPVLVKHPESLAEVQGLVLPGGESTTLGTLIRKYGLYEPIRERAQRGMPIFGTCAGLILLARKIEGQDDHHLNLMDITVNRNSFGRQRDSFEADIEIAGLSGAPFPGVFIRAPHIVTAGSDVQVLAMYRDRIVAARQGNLLAASFHPELTADLRLHEYFKAVIEQHCAAECV